MNEIAKAFDAAGKCLDVMIAKMIELKALPIALVFASEKGFYAASPEGVPVPTLLEWIDVWPGKDRK